MLIFVLSSLGKVVGSTTDYALIICIGVALFVLYAMLGFCTCRNENRFCCVVNFLFTTVILGLFGVLSVLLIAFKGDYLFYLNTACATTVGDGSTGMISQLINIYPNADKFGVNSVCSVPIISNTTIINEIQARLTTKCPTASTCTLMMSSSGYYRVPGDSADPCNVQVYTGSTKKYVSALAALFGFIESQASCTGICNETPMNYFSYTDTMPMKSCKDRISELIDSNMVVFTAVCSVIAAFIFLEMFGLCVICCHPNNKINSKRTEDYNE